MSLFGYFFLFFYYKIKETLPGALRRLCGSRIIHKREAPFCTRTKGSITVEASVVLPLLACFFSFLLFYFRIMEVQLIVQDALEDTGRKLAVLAVKELEEPDIEMNYLMTAKGLLLLKLKEEPLLEQYVSGGAPGVSLLASEFDGDVILLNANYVMRFPVKLFGNQDFLVCQKTQFRKWNGWHSIAEAGDATELVYVTEYGEVYHMRRSCAYLDLSVQEVLYTELEDRRNNSGAIYRLCELCGTDDGTVVTVYITNYGECYHRTITCSGLKRTIYQKLLSEVGGMPACKKCSK